MFGARRVARRTARRTSRRVARRNMFMSGGYGGYEEEPYSSPPPVPAAPKPTIEQQLLNLQELQNKGLITEDDYNSKKKQILGI